MQINFKKTCSGSVEQLILKVTEALKAQDFGVLTRIDLDAKFKEKLGKTVNQTVILGACNPQLAYESYMANTDIASLLPCNVVLRDLGSNQVSIEIVKPTALMKILGDSALEKLASSADDKLAEVLGVL